MWKKVSNHGEFPDLDEDIKHSMEACLLKEGVSEEICCKWNVFRRSVEWWWEASGRRHMETKDQEKDKDRI